MKGLTLPELLRRRALERPEAQFLFFDHEGWSRGELDRASDGAADEILRGGVRAGDRVALLLPNCPEFIIYFFAVLKSAAVAVPVNPLLKEPEIGYILRNSGAKVLVAEAGKDSLIGALRSQCPDLNHVQTLAAGQPKKDVLSRLGRAASAPLSADPEAPAAIIYTSGTTGFPKGAVLSHRNYLFDVENSVEAIGMDEKDRFLCFLPLFHVNAQVVTLLCPLYAGGSMVLMGRFQPKEFFELLAGHRCTAFSGVPSVYSVLLSLPETGRYDLSSLRFCICGAAPMPVEVFQRFEAKFKAHILEGYGLSEGTCVSSLNPPPPGKRKVGSIGLPLKGQAMRIVGEDGAELEAGRVGEIAVSGENVMKGYWNDSEASFKALRDGWLFTGDLGCRDEEGYFFIVGRKKEMIIRGGENVYPKEIEEALYKNPKIAEAAVVGLPDRRWGEEVAAFIVLRQGCASSAKEIVEALRARVADFKLPRRVEFVTELPKTATGKVQKHKLKEAYRQG
ncbi:MAG: long-chain fatty acid--CoA ligase [Elusimicrobia bacterium]|nr:long-chain fatty acid--CoA ligase [Elusimicrobiota bacterium]